MVVASKYIKIQKAQKEQEPVEEIEEKAASMSEEESEFVTLWNKFEEKAPRLSQASILMFQEQLNVLASKMLDYGTENITAGTDLKTPEDINFVLQGIWFRISDKVNRWKNLMRSGAQPNNESLYDTFTDIANYAVIAKLVSRGLWEKK